MKIERDERRFDIHDIGKAIKIVINFQYKNYAILRVRLLAAAFAASLVALQRSSLYGAVRRKEELPFSMPFEAMPLYPLRYPIFCVQHERPSHQFLPSKLAVILFGEVIVYHFYLLSNGKVFVLLHPPEQH